MRRIRYALGVARSGDSENILLVSLTCSSTGHPAVGRFEWSNGAWYLTAASRQRPGSVIPEEDARSARQGQFMMAAEYPGCPSCRADSYARCWVCHNLACWDRTWPRFDCPSCGRSGPVEGTIDSVKPIIGG
jgi:hypothetical protein